MSVRLTIHKSYSCKSKSNSNIRVILTPLGSEFYSKSSIFYFDQKQNQQILTTECAKDV